MEYRENPMFGRVVFFLNPPLSLENSVIPALKDKDYEVYIIRDYTCAKPILKTRDNAICFIFIDDELSFDGWFNFIKSFDTDPELKSVFLGVISIKAKPKDQERYMMNLKLPGGFIIYEKNMANTTENIEKILQLNGAKGVRKCIRLALNDNNDVNGYFTNGTMLYSFRLVDLSALGFAAIVPPKMASIFQRGKVIPNVSITMKRYSFVCSIVVYNVNISNGNCMVVMMLHPETSASVKKKIHDFIYETLELRHRILLESVARDMTDYSIRKKDPDEIDDVEEIEDSENSASENDKSEVVKESSEEEHNDSDAETPKSENNESQE